MRGGALRLSRLAIAAACGALLAAASPQLAAASASPLPIGADCTAAIECASTFCVDGVCCNSACDEPAENCAIGPNPGTCQDYAAPAPAMSAGALLAALGALLAVAALAVLRLRREV